MGRTRLPSLPGRAGGRGLSGRAGPGDAADARPGTHRGSGVRRRGGVLDLFLLALVFGGAFYLANDRGLFGYTPEQLKIFRNLGKRGVKTVAVFTSPT